MSETGLTTKEQSRLAVLEEKVDTFVQGFLHAGEALKEIRDKKLWREDHDSFESYAKSRFSLPVCRKWPPNSVPSPLTPVPPVP